MTIPKSKKEFKKLIKANISTLKEYGFGIWAEGSEIGKGYNKNDIMLLIPGTWYRFIPTGFTIVNLTGLKKKFSHKTCDNDTRFGCLAYGIVKKIKK